MNESVVGRLTDQATFAAAARDPTTPEWIRNHWETFEESMTGEVDGSPFPCFFGAESVRQGDPLYTALGSMSDPGALRQLGTTLLEYLDTWEDHSDRASLVAVFRPPAGSWSEREYHEALWNILQFLHVHDPEPWPTEIPTDTDHPEWEFSFGGEPMFPTCRAPFYEERQSRYCPVGLEITFQPRALFEKLNVTGGHPTGERAREQIRKRLEAYDGVSPHRFLGEWGVEGDREWHQYMLPEDESLAPDSPPIHITRDHPKGEPIEYPGSELLA